MASLLLAGGPVQSAPAYKKGSKAANRAVRALDEANTVSIASLSEVQFSPQPLDFIMGEMTGTMSVSLNTPNGSHGTLWLQATEQAASNIRPSDLQCRVSSGANTIGSPQNDFGSFQQLPTTPIAIWTGGPGMPGGETAQVTLTIKIRNLRLYPGPSAQHDGRFYNPLTFMVTSSG
ncbi:MAG TPA: hypothetical protein VGA96_03890 [Fibrella sp.]